MNEKKKPSKTSSAPAELLKIKLANARKLQQSMKALAATLESIKESS